MAGNRSAAEDLRQRLEKWRQDREDAKQEAKAAQKPIFAVRHTGKVSSPPSASVHKKKTRAATPSPRPITVPIRHQSRLAERHTISSANKRVQRNEAAPRIEAPAKSDEAPAGKYAPKHPSPLLYSRTASLECGSMHVTPPREYERRTEKPLLHKLLRHLTRVRKRANKLAKKKAKAARK